MKKSTIVLLVVCLLVSFTSNVFAAQEKIITDKELITQGTFESETSTSKIVQPDHYVGYVCTSDIWQNYGNVGGQGCTSCTSAVEELRIITYIFEDDVIKSHDEENGYNISLLFGLPSSIPYNSSKVYRCASNHWITHDGQVQTGYSYEYL